MSEAKNTPTERRFADVAHTPGNLSLLAIWQTMRDLIVAIDGFLETHPPGCECVFCASNKSDHMEQILSDLKGIRWALGFGESVIYGETALPHDHPEFRRLYSNIPGGDEWVDSLLADEAA